MSLFIISITCTLSAQIKNGLKGPAAKNYKPWKATTVQPQSVIYTYTLKGRSQGPAAKNDKPWKNDRPDAANRRAVKAQPLNTRKGPAAKNYKPWNRTEDI